MRKLLLSLSILPALFGSAHADWTAKNASGDTITFSNPNACTSIVCVPTAQLVTSSGASIYGSAGVSNTTVLSVQGIASGTALPVSATFWPYTMGQQSTAASVPVVLPAAQISTLTPLSTVTANLGTLNGAATAAKQPALGTAGAASSDVITVQGIASMVPFLNNPGTPASWGIGAFGAAQPANGIALGAYDGTNLIRAKGDETNGIWVNVKAGGAGGGAVYGPTAEGAPAANPPVLVGGTADGTGTGTISPWKVASGVGFINCSNCSGTGISVAYAGAIGSVGTPGGFKDGSGNFQPMLGDVTNGQWVTIKGTLPAFASTPTVNIGTIPTTAVTQSGTWTVQPGNTANTTAWLVTGTGGVFPSSQSGTWNINNVAGTISLPTGAATSAAQATTNTTLGTTTSSPCSLPASTGSCDQTSLLKAIANAANGPVPLGTTGGWTPLTTAALSTTVTSIKSSGGQLGQLYCYNPNASVAYVQVFNATSGSVTLGTTSASQIYAIPATNAGGLAVSVVGIQFSTAISYAATTTATGNTAPGTAITCSVGYI